MALENMHGASRGVARGVAWQGGAWAAARAAHLLDRLAVQGGRRQEAGLDDPTPLQRCQYLLAERRSLVTLDAVKLHAPSGRNAVRQVRV